MKEYFYTHEHLKDGHEVSLFGRAINGAVERYDDEIIAIGEDAALILPRHNLVGVFDGAGGAGDVGSAKEAALTAADAVRWYVERRDEAELPEAMRYAREAVAANAQAGLCVGALARFTSKGIEAVNAGDTSITLFGKNAQTMDMLAEPQTVPYDGDPANYLGRQVARIPAPSASDLYTEYSPLSPGDAAFLMTDGVFGNWVDGTDLQDYHFEVAYERNDPTTQLGRQALLRTLLDRPVDYERARRADDATVVMVRRPQEK